MKLISKSMSRKITKTIRKCRRKIKKYAPEIRIVGGIVVGWITVGTACHKTAKLDPILDEAKAQIDDIHERVEENKVSQNLVVVNEKKELTTVYAKTAVKVVKLYAPVVGMGVMSTAMILTGMGILRQRNTALVAAYTTVSDMFAKYRDRVVKKYGEEEDKELFYGTQQRVIVDAETGEQTTVKELAPSNDDEDYVMCFDSNSRYWDSNPEYARCILNETRNWMQAVLESKGYVWLNDMCYELDIPCTKRGQVVGWVNDSDSGVSDNYVDLRIEQVERMRPDGTTETVFLLDPNVDGVILDRFTKVIKR